MTGSLIDSSYWKIYQFQADRTPHGGCQPRGYILCGSCGFRSEIVCNPQGEISHLQGASASQRELCSQARPIKGECLVVVFIML